MMTRRDHVGLCSVILVAILATMMSPNGNLGLGVSVARADQADDDYAVAVGFYKGSRWDLAAQAFQKFLNDNPKHTRAPISRLYLGLSLSNLEKYDQARPVLRDFVKEFANNAQVPTAMYWIAVCSYFLDDWKSADMEFTAFLAKSPDDPKHEDALTYLGDSQLRLGKPEVAEGTFQQAIKLFPQGKLLEDAQFGLSRSFEKQQKLEQALALYRQLAASKTDKLAAQAQWHLAQLLFESKDYANAAKEYDSLCKTFSESRYVSAARLNAGYSFYEVKDFKSASAQFEQAAKDAPQAPAATYWRGMSQKQQADFAGAATILKGAFEVFPQDPLAEQMLFQWADCELRQSQFASAETHFVEVSDRWPKGQWADDALFFGGEAALQRANREANAEARLAALAAAEGYAKKLVANYADGGLKLHGELLRGRALLARGADTDVAAAAEAFKSVLAGSQRPQTQLQARLYLARAQQRLRQHAATLETLGPVVEQARKEGAASEFVDSILLQATSLLAEKKFAEAVNTSAEYLRLVPTGPQAEQSLATKALAEGNQGQLTLAKESLNRLRQASPSGALSVATSHQLAEIAYAAKQFDQALEWFTNVVNASPQSPQLVAALSGQAWCQFETKQFKPAAAGFARLLKEFPQHELAAESAVKLGECLQADKQPEEAAKAFAEAFDKFTPNRFAYLAGLQRARVLRELRKIDEADAAYQKLLEKYPKPDRLDLVFDEWALLNHENERFARADEIFKRLITETPNSVLADNARYSLAESELASSQRPDGSVDAAKVEAAKAAFRQLEQSSESDADVQQDSLFRLVGIAEEQSKWDELAKSAEALRTRFAEGRYKSDAAFYLALSQVHRGQGDAAGELLKPLLSAKNDPAMKQKHWFPRVFVLLSEIQWRAKQYPQVIETVTAFRTWDPQNRWMYQAEEVLGRAYKQQTKFDEARNSFKRVLADPNGARTETAAKAQLMIAETYFITKDYKAALEGYLKVHILYKFPDWQSAALFQAGLCDEQLGQWKNAVDDYESLIREFPKSEFAEKAKPRLDVAKRNVKK